MSHTSSLEKSPDKLGEDADGMDPVNSTADRADTLLEG